jgi:hypothetical protein
MLLLILALGLWLLLLLWFVIKMLREVTKWLGLVLAGRLLLLARLLIVRLLVVVLL